MTALNKVCFIADWHIKLKTKGVPDSWAKDRFFKVCNAIEDTLQGYECDALIVGGDTFDRLPTLEELALFMDFFENVSVPTYIIDGNHEATKKGQTFLSIIKGLVKNPNVEFVLDYKSIVGIDFIPYCKLKDFATKGYDGFTNKVLVTHVRGEIPPHVHPEVPLELFGRWQVVLAGDLHSHSNSQRNIIYPGSPVTTSFHREVVKTGCIILDVNLLKYEWVEFNVPQLIRKTVRAGDPMPETEWHHTIYEVEGDMHELATLKDSSVLDKKVVKRSSDATLILSPEMSIETELREYLTYILELPESTIAEVVTLYHDNFKTT